MARRGDGFQTIHSEGGLLPSDLLRRIVDPKGQIPGTTPEDYGLPHGERINETITQSWNRLRRHWAEFIEAARNLPEGEAGTGLTNDRWNLPLLRELGFGLLPTSTGPDVGGRTYAISRFFGPVAVHLIGCNLSLDRRAAGIRGAAAANPHGLVQEFLNRAQGYLWGIVSNGLRFRILRDNQALSRQSYLEFDLEAMFEGEVFSDFVLLWLTAHATRFTVRDGGRPESCRLEEWSKVAEEQGARALESLKDGVEKALEVLGQGFVGHPRNTVLRERLRSNVLSLNDFHAQLLRVVYRLIFLFVAEDRTLEGIPVIHQRDDSEGARLARTRYADHYGTARLRELAGHIRGSRHGDLWQQFNLITGALSGDVRFAAAREHLALPVFGGFLWSAGSTAAVNAPNLSEDGGTGLSNVDFLEAIRHLAFTRQGKVLRPVDYKNLGSEELGGVYESLLALTPQISGDGTRFTFAEFAGNERKTSGSYYTPDSLVQCLLDSALDPVIEAAIRGKTGTEAEKAILSLKVCDPAVGSGHFLVGAAHRFARHLARVRAVALGESEPSPPVYQHALRDVVSHCLYGVDMNPMAAELCKVGLWLEAMEPGKPLSFLDHHIRVGNSLLGTTPELMAKGIPDEAFKPIEGDDPAVAAAVRKRNRQQRATKQGEMFFTGLVKDQQMLSELSAEFEDLSELSDDTIKDVADKSGLYKMLVSGYQYLEQKRLADLWMAAFVWPLTAKTADSVPTEEVFRTFVDGSHRLAPGAVDCLKDIKERYQFFHWHLEFPDVFAEGRGGFDCVLGNPPWERVKLQEKEWFAERSPEIAAAPNAAARKHLIEALKASDPVLYKQFQDDSRAAEGESHLLRNTARYPLCGRGDVNLYAVFAENMRFLLNSRGRMGCVLPSGIATDDTTKYFFQNVVETKSLVSLFDFENRLKLFSDVDSRMKFCLFTSERGEQSRGTEAEFVFFAHSVEELYETNRRFTLSATDIGLLNPNTRTCPIFRSSLDAELTKAIYRRAPVLIREARDDKFEENPWGIRYTEMFHSAHDSRHFLPPNTSNGTGDLLLPYYEAKQMFHFDHRWASYKSTALVELDKTDPFEIASGSYLVPRSVIIGKLAGRWERKWRLAWRDITANTNERTLVAAIIPEVVTSDKLPVGALLDASLAPLLVACLSSFLMDYVARQKMGGTMKFHVFKQLPAPSPVEYARDCPWASGKINTWLLPYVLELSYTAWDLEAFGKDNGYHGPPFRWNEARRFLLRCELDAAFFHLYLGEEEEWSREPQGVRNRFPTPRHAVDYIMETFPIVKRKDEAAFGRYRTKDTILEIYDALADAIRTGRPYQTSLNPPPGPPADEQGNFSPLPNWEPGEPQPVNWPSHIHAPKEVVIQVPEEIPLEEFSAMAYPATDTDRAVCAAALSIVEQTTEVSSELHLDVLLLATHPDWCRLFLDPQRLLQFDTAGKSVTKALFLGNNQAVGWKDCRDHLERHNAIVINRIERDQKISLGPNAEGFKMTLPQGIDAIVVYAVEAARRLVEVRQGLLPVPDAQKKIIEVMGNQHRIYRLAG